MKHHNPWIRAVMFAGVSAAALLLLTAVLTKLVETETLSMTLLPAYGYVLTVLSALAGCLCTALSSKKYRLATTAVTGGVYLLLLCVFNGVLCRGEFQNLLPTAALILFAVLAAVLISVLLKRNRQFSY